MRKVLLILHNFSLLVFVLVSFEKYSFVRWNIFSQFSRLSLDFAWYFFIKASFTPGKLKNEFEFKVSFWFVKWALFLFFIIVGFTARALLNTSSYRKIVRGPSSVSSSTVSIFQLIFRIDKPFSLNFTVFFLWWIVSLTVSQAGRSKSAKNRPDYPHQGLYLTSVYHLTLFLYPKVLFECSNFKNLKLLIYPNTPASNKK